MDESILLGGLSVSYALEFTECLRRRQVLRPAGVNRSI